MTDGQLDINAVFRRGTLKVDPEETAAELAARLKAEGRAKLLEDIKGMTVFIVILLVLLAAGCLCVREAFFDPSATAETQQWARAMLTTLITSSVTFVIGRKIGKGSGEG